LEPRCAQKVENMGFDANEPMTTIHLQMAGIPKGCVSRHG
jgi:hypothetical protein